jgi:hypothetical protein
MTAEERAEIMSQWDYHRERIARDNWQCGASAPRDWFESILDRLEEAEAKHAAREVAEIREKIGYNPECPVHNPGKVGCTCLCENPHADGRYDYFCGSKYCRCLQ